MGPGNVQTFINFPIKNRNNPRIIFLNCPFKTSSLNSPMASSFRSYNRIVMTLANSFSLISCKCYTISLILSFSFPKSKQKNFFFRRISLTLSSNTKPHNFCAYFFSVKSFWEREKVKKIKFIRMEIAGNRCQCSLLIVLLIEELNENFRLDGGLGIE